MEGRTHLTAERERNKTDNKEKVNDTKNQTVIYLAAVYLFYLLKANPVAMVVLRIRNMGYWATYLTFLYIKYG